MVFSDYGNGILIDKNERPVGVSADGEGVENPTTKVVLAAGVSFFKAHNGLFCTITWADMSMPKLG